MMDSHPSRGHTRQEMIANTMLKGEGGLCFLSFGSSEACRERENLGNLKGLSSVCLGALSTTVGVVVYKSPLFSFPDTPHYTLFTAVCNHSSQGLDTAECDGRRLTCASQVLRERVPTCVVSSSPSA